MKADTKQRKAEIQQRIDGLQAQVEQYQVRRAELVGDRVRLAQSIANQTEAMGAALIEGKDLVKGSDALMRDQVRLNGTNTAIQQLDDRLAQLDQQAKQARIDHAGVDFDRLTDEADDLFLAFVDHFHAAYDSLNALERKYEELASMGQSAGRSVDNDDHVRFMRGAAHFWQDLIRVRIGQMLDNNQAVSQVIADARARRNA